MKIPVNLDDQDTWTNEKGSGVENKQTRKNKESSAEEALRQSEERYRALADNTLFGIAVMDTQHRIIHVNATMVRMFRKSADEFIGKHCFREFEKREAVCSHCPGVRTMATGETAQVETQGVRDDGSNFYVRIRTAPCFGPDGSVSGFIEMVEDIDAWKRAEINLRVSEGQLSNALKMAQAGHWEYDMDSDMFTFNDNFFRIFRTTAEEEGGYAMSWREYIKRFCHPDDIPIVTREVEGAIKSTDPDHSHHIEHRITYADGETGYVAVRFFIAKDPEGRIIKTYGIIQDITERKASEDLIRQSLREKEVMLKEIHHRVKNNLQLISSMLGLQKKYVKDDEDRELFIDSQSRIRSMALVHERLYKSDNLARIGFNDFVGRLVDEVSKTYLLNRDRIKISVNSGEHYLSVDTAVPVAQIITELVSNSIKYAFPEEREGEIAVGFTQNEDVYSLTVSDNGIGPPPDFTFPGSDTLGLTLVDNFIKQLKGRLELERKDGLSYTIIFRESSHS